MMRTKLKEKLHSRRGASITFALLLFMVCAAIGSVVLASATATAGRASGNYEYDQRYFAVTSAAELLRETLNGESMTVTTTQTTTRLDEVTVLFDKTGAPMGSPSTAQGVPSAAYGDPHVKDSEGNTPNSSSLLYKALSTLISGRDAATLFAADALALPATVETEPTESFTLTVTPSTPTGTGSTPIAGLTVTVTMTIRRDGSLFFVLENEEGVDKYRLQMTLTANKSTDAKTDFELSEAFSDDTHQTVTSAPDPVDEHVTVTRYERYTKQITKSHTIRWQASEITPYTPPAGG